MTTSQWNVRQSVNHGPTDSIPLQCPPQTPGCHCTQSRGVRGYPLDVESFSPQLEGVEHLPEVAAIPGLVQTIQECAFQISNPDPDVANPDSTGAKEPLCTHLHESVCDSSNAATPGGLADSEPRSRGTNASVVVRTNTVLGTCSVSPWWRMADQ